MLIAYSGNIGPVISQAEGLASSRLCEGASSQHAARKNEKLREMSFSRRRRARKPTVNVHGPALCSSSNLLDCCVGETLIEEEQNYRKTSSVSCRQSWNICIII